MLLNHTLRSEFVHRKAKSAPKHASTTPATVVSSVASAQNTPATPFARFPHAMAADTRLSTTERLLGAAILFWAMDKPTATMSNRSLAKYLGVSLSVIERGLRALVRLGYIACEVIKATATNSTGRIVHLTWATDPSVLPAAPSRRHLEATDVEGTSPATGGPVAVEGGATSPATGGASSGVTDKEASRREPKIPKKAGADSGGRQRPQAEDGHTVGDSDGIRALGGSPVDRAVLNARQLGAMTTNHSVDVNKMVLGTTDTDQSADGSKLIRTAPNPGAVVMTAPGGPNLTEGQQAVLAAMTPDQRSAFEAKSPGLQADILRPFADAFEPMFFERITRSQLAVPRFVAEARPVEHTTPGLLAAVADGDARHVANLAESLCRDLGGAGDRRRWGALFSLAGQVFAREVTVEAVLDSLRQAQGPGADVPGAVFVHALRAHGWRPRGGRRELCEGFPKLSHALMLDRIE